MVFLLTLPSVITICKVSIDGMRIQGRIVEKSKKVGSTFKKKAKWFGYTLWRLAYYLGLNFRNQTNYFDHSYTHCSKGVFFQKGHEIFFAIFCEFCYYCKHHFKAFDELFRIEF